MSTHTNPSGQAPSVDEDALEREIEQTREELVDTVEAIVERVDPSKVVHRNVEQVKRNTHRATEDAQQRARELQQQAQQTAAKVQHDARVMVQEDPDRVRTIGLGLMVVALFAMWMSRRHRRR